MAKIGRCDPDQTPRRAICVVMTLESPMFYDHPGDNPQNVIEQKYLAAVETLDDINACFFCSNGKKTTLFKWLACDDFFPKNDICPFVIPTYKPASTKLFGGFLHPTYVTIKTRWNVPFPKTQKKH